MYGEADLRAARHEVRICGLKMAAVLVPLLAVYVLGIFYALSALMLGALLLAFAFCVFAGDFWLMPSLRYCRFLKEMDKGLRRSTDCILKRMDANVQMQDGVRVCMLHVELCEGGDSRIFYVNASKLELMPEMERRVRLVSYGRHVAACEEF